MGSEEAIIKVEKEEEAIKCEVEDGCNPEVMKPSDGVRVHRTRDSYNVRTQNHARLRRLLDKLMKNHSWKETCGLAPEILEDLYHLIKKAVAIRKHLERNKKDKDSKLRLILVESRIHRLARYYKWTKKLPPPGNKAAQLKEYSKGMIPFGLLVIDEAAQLKECETLIPLQLPEIQHAVLIGDEHQLPATIISKVRVLVLILRFLELEIGYILGFYDFASYHTIKTHLLSKTVNDSARK
ncbi:hypothetical protein GIB67_019228 [Kingdonia uniflora]|uniref:DNA2/NAM7 helicase helicase domain-containing protein n=1 Tax=Kingdonia uniflora TaxID=39325 RepID=A0A7J7MZT0_9MAGN|nr:hypothetical protein GIB67_019228 [Kingdonia uniflora]